MKPYQTIILGTDTTQHSRVAAQTALDIAQRHGAKLWIVDTISRPSRLSHWFSNDSDGMFEFVVSQKQERLEQYAVTFQEAGLDVNTRLLIGNASQEIARLATAEQADLVIRYRKGLASRVPSLFGTTARNLMRLCPCPLLLVADQPLDQPNVLACINVEHESAENEAILQAGRTIAGDAGKWHALFCWKFYGGEYLAEYVDKQVMQDYLEVAERNYRGLFEKFLVSHGLSDVKDRVVMQQGEPVELIPNVCRNDSIDVVVMSSASQNHPLHRLLGSTVESILDQLRCALLLVKPVNNLAGVSSQTSSVQTD